MNFCFQVYPVQVDPDQDENVHMFFARGERWRRLRSIVNPAFSTSKMKDVSGFEIYLETGTSEVGPTSNSKIIYKNLLKTNYP